MFLELPSVPIFYDTNGKVINNLTAPYTIKSELKVKCEVLGGKLSSSIVKNFSTFCLFNIPIYLDENRFCCSFEHVCFFVFIQCTLLFFILQLILSTKNCCTYVTFFLMFIPLGLLIKLYVQKNMIETLLFLLFL